MMGSACLLLVGVNDLFVLKVFVNAHIDVHSSGGDVRGYLLQALALALCRWLNVLIR